MAIKPGKILWIALLLVLLLVCGIGLGIIPVNLFFAKKAIAAQIQEHTGWKLDLNGKLSVRLGPRPVLRASDLQAIGPAEANHFFIEADNLLIRTKISSLLKKRLDVSELQLLGVQPDFCAISLCEADALPSSLDLNGSAPYGKSLSIQVDGEHPGGDMFLSTESGSLSMLLEDPDSYPLAIELIAFGSNLLADGEVDQPLSDPRLSASLTFTSEDVTELFRIFEIEVAALGALSFDSELKAGADRVKVQNLDATVAGHRLTMDGQVTNLDSRPVIEIDGILNHLDPGLLASLFGSDPSAASTEPRAWLDTDLSPLFALLNRADGQLRLQIGEIIGSPVSLEEILAKASLRSGLLKFERIEAFIAGSPLEGSARLDPGQDCPALEYQFGLYDFDLGHLAALLEPGLIPEGRIAQLDIESSSCGRSAAQHFESFTASANAADLLIQLEGDMPPLLFNSASLNTGWQHDSRLSFDSALISQAVQGSIQLGALGSILSGEQWPFEGVVSTSDSRFVMSGDAAYSETGLELDSKVRLDIERMGSLAAWTGIDPESELPLSANTALRIGSFGLELHGLAVSLGNSDLEGRINWPRPEHDAAMEIDLASSRLDVNELAGLVPEKPIESAADSSPPLALDELRLIETWLRFPRVDLDLSASQIRFANYRFSDLQVHSVLQDRLIEHGQLGFRLNDIEVEGALAMDFRERPGKMAWEFELENVDIGDILSGLEMGGEIDARADSLRLTINSNGSSLRQLIENTSLDSKLETFEWTFYTGPERHQQQLELAEFELLIAPGAPSVWLSHGELNGVPIRARMETPSWQAVFDRRMELPLKLVLGAGNDLLMLDGTVDGRASENRRADLTISGDLQAQPDVDLATLTSPLDDYELRSTVNISENQIQLSNLAARIGNSRVGGSANVRYMDPGYFLDVDLISPYFETDDIVQWLEDYRKADRLVNSPEKASGAEEDDAGLFALLIQQANQFIEKFDFDISLGADELYSGGIFLGKSRLESHSDGGNLSIDLDVDLEGGNIEADYLVAETTSGAEHKLDIHIEDLEYGGLVRLFNPDAQAQGWLYLDTSLDSRAPEVSRIDNFLEGHFDLVVFPRGIEAGFLDLWASNLVFALLSAGGDQDKQLNCMVARFEVENGVMSSTNTFLDTTDIIIRTRGNIDLANRELDLLIAPQAKREKFLSVSTPLEVKGPFQEFDVDVAPGGFVMTVLRWYYGLIYVPWKWITGERFPEDGIATCYNAMGWELPVDAE